MEEVIYFTYIFQTRICVFNRLVCMSRPEQWSTLIFWNLYFSLRWTSGENFKYVALLDLKKWVYWLIYKPICKIQTKKLDFLKFFRSSSFTKMYPKMQISSFQPFTVSSKIWRSQGIVYLFASTNVISTYFEKV